MKNAALFATMVISLTASSGSAQSTRPDPQPLLMPVNQFLTAINNLDEKGASQAFAADPVILDDVAPHQFVGAGSFHRWYSALSAAMSTYKITGATMTIGAPTDIQIETSAAYLSVPGVYSFSMAGKPMHQPGRFAFTFARSGTSWKISSFGWAGENPVP